MTIISDLRALAGTLRAPVLAVLLVLGSLMLQGCAVAALTAVGIAGSAGIKHTVNGISYMTFNHSVVKVRAGALLTLKHMDITVTEDTETETGWLITASAENREIDIELERLTKRLTRMRAVANIGSFFFKDSATSSAIISQTEENLTLTSQALAAPRSLPTPPTSSSETVRNIQTSLATLGYKPGPADGILGHQTRNAIEAFQRDRGLPVTGEASAWLDLLLIDRESARSTPSTPRFQRGYPYSARRATQFFANASA